MRHQPLLESSVTAADDYRDVIVSLAEALVITSQQRLEEL